MRAVPERESAARVDMLYPLTTKDLCFMPVVLTTAEYAALVSAEEYLLNRATDRQSPATAGAVRARERMKAKIYFICITSKVDGLLIKRSGSRKFLRRLHEHSHGLPQGRAHQ